MTCKFCKLIFIIFVVLINGIKCLKFSRSINSSLFYTDHGLLVGYFTFSGKGVAGLSYELMPFDNSSQYRFSVFPMAFNPYANLRRIKRFYSLSLCKEFYLKSVHTVDVLNSSSRISLGRFSGGFAIALILSNKFSCLQIKRRLELKDEIKSELLNVEVTIYNPDNTGVFTDHLSASDQGVSDVLKLLLILYIGMMLWTAYSMRISQNVELKLMLVIQKVVGLIVTVQIVIIALLLIAYERLANIGEMSRKLEIVAETLAIISRYLEFYIVISWTLSRQRESCRQQDDVARFLCVGALCHVLSTIGHYALIKSPTDAISCITVWECETHLFSMGFASPDRYNETLFGWAAFMFLVATYIGSSMFVLHLLRLGLSTVEFTVRRAYVSVFCSVSMFWFWSYPFVWTISSLVTDYYQFKFVLLVVSIFHISAIPAILRVTRISPNELETQLPSSILNYD